MAHIGRLPTLNNIAQAPDHQSTKKRGLKTGMLGKLSGFSRNGLRGRVSRMSRKHVFQR